MSRLSKTALIAFVIATLAGACLHFVYVLVPNAVTAIFAPVNESIWEHIKILFWPYLAAALFLTRKEEKGSLATRMLSLLVICIAMPVIGYIYHIILGGEALAFDLCLYVLLMAAGFLLPCAFSKPFPQGTREVILLLTLAFGVAIVLFTFLPPDLLLFIDLSGANTWSRLPC